MSGHRCVLYVDVRTKSDRLPKCRCAINSVQTINSCCPLQVYRSWVEQAAASTEEWCQETHIIVSSPQPVKTYIKQFICWSTVTPSDLTSSLFCSCSGCPRSGQIPLYTWVLCVSRGHRECLTNMLARVHESISRTCIHRADLDPLCCSYVFAVVQLALRTWITLITWMKTFSR